MKAVPKLIAATCFILLLHACSLDLIEAPGTGGLTSPVAAFTITNGGCYAPCQVIFTNTSTDATAFEWNFGDGTPKVNSGNPTHTYDLPGDYIITLKATNSTGSDVETKTVLIKTLTFKKTFGGSGHDVGRSTQQTNDGGYILLGYNESEGAGASDLYLIKTDKDGNVE